MRRFKNTVVSLLRTKRELIRNNLLLASSVTTSNLEEIVERIVGPEDFLRRQ